MSVLNTELLLSQAYTEKAVATTNTISEECALHAVNTVLTAVKVIAFMAINAVIAKLTTNVIEPINTSYVIFKSVAVVAILTEISMAD